MVWLQDEERLPETSYRRHSTSAWADEGDPSPLKSVIPPQSVTAVWTEGEFRHQIRSAPSDCSGRSITGSPVLSIPIASFMRQSGIGRRIAPLAEGRNRGRLAETSRQTRFWWWPPQ